MQSHKEILLAWQTIEHKIFNIVLQKDDFHFSSSKKGFFMKQLPNIRK
jgi:hypothetical protein